MRQVRVGILHTRESSFWPDGVRQFDLHVGVSVALDGFGVEDLFESSAQPCQGPADLPVKAGDLVSAAAIAQPSPFRLVGLGEGIAQR